MGNPARPIALRILEGNPGKRPIKPTPQPHEGGTTPPAWLGAGARREWRRMVRELAYMNLLTVADRDALACYCTAVARLAQMERDGTDAPVEWERVLRQIRAFAGEFGLTPSSRARLSVPEKVSGSGTLLD